MALTLGDNFSYQGAKPLDARLNYSTVAAMKAVADATMYEGCLAYCIEADKTFQWKSTNTVDETTGKWREYASGGGGGASYTAGDGIDITNDVISTEKSEAGDIDKIIDRYPTAGALVSIVNAFNKGDLYSADEKMIGQWIDGKPLYQKVVSGNITTTEWNTFNHNIANIETSVKIEAYLTMPNSRNIPYVYTLGRTVANDGMMASFSPSNWGVNVSSAFSSGTVTAILRYTKTTDQAVSIGEANEYSTEEKIIGTWIDGKPVYQKTFSGTVESKSNYTAHDLGITGGIDTIVNVSGVMDNNKPMIAISNDAFTASIAFYIYPNDFSTASRRNTYECFAKPDGNQTYVGHTFIFHLQYTKTT